MNVIKLLRGFFTGLCAFAFVLLLSSFLVLWVLEDFTSESKMRPILNSIFFDLIDKQLDPHSEGEIDKEIRFLCSSNKEAQATFAGFSLNISCDKYFAINNTKAFLAEEISSSIYEESKDCDVDCILSQETDFLITKKANMIYKNLLLYNAIAALLFGILYFALKEGSLSQKMSSLSILVFLVCIPGLLVILLANSMKEKFISAGNIADPIIEALRSIIIQKYLILLSFGASFLLISLFIKFFEKKAQN